MRKVLLIVVGLLLIVGGILRSRPHRPDPPVAAKPATAPATQIARAPTSKPATAPARPVDFMDVVKHAYPDFPTTQPLMVPVAMNEAARLIINDPIYLDSLGELWITRGDAEATSAVFKTVHERSTHVVRDIVVFVHRWTDDRGVWQPQLVVRRDDGKYEIVTRSARQTIESTYNYQWNRAFEWNDAIVVPTDRGISVIRPDRRPMEIHHDFVSAEQYDPNRYSQVVALLDWRGLIAWIPWEGDLLGSKGAARFLEDKWTVLDSEKNWPDKLIHLVPMLDGSVLQIVQKDDGNAEILMAAADLNDVDTKAITSLVDQLSDPDSKKREEAFVKLSQYGIGSWPLLEKLLPDQTPEARFRLEQLLSAKTQPHLQGMLVQPGPLKVLARGENGTVMLHAPNGVAMPRPIMGAADIVAPAIISIIPGKSINLVPQGFLDEMKPEGRRMCVIGGEWYITDKEEGPKWWLSNHFSANLLKPTELEFKELVGLDGHGRWLFRKKADDNSPTLIIDPTLPNPTPRLPVWVYKLEEGGQTGWNQDNWPAIKYGGAWTLVKNDWQPINEEKNEKFITAREPTTAPATQPIDTLILTETDGTRFFDGQSTLRMIQPDGKQIDWTLPAEAVGTGDVTLIRAGDHRLFLFNQSGRVIRLTQLKAGPEPFKVEAIFTRRIPDSDKVARIWLDPAGRIVFAYDTNTLAICFPDGRVPSEITQKMTTKDLADLEQ